MRVSIDATNFVQSDKNVQGLGWKNVNYPSPDNRYFMESGGETVTGFIQGQDLKINLRNFPEFTNSQYYCGIFRVDSLLNQSMEFYDEIYLQYGKANNTVAEPFDFAVNTIKRDKLKDVHGFRFDQFESVADFTIDQAYFDDPNGRYRCFIVVKEACQYRSYLFDEFGSQPEREIPVGNIEITAIDIDNTSLSLANGACLFNVPPCSVIEIEAKLDVTAFDADLLAKGYPGTFANYFAGYKAWISEGMNQTGFDVPGQVVIDSYAVGFAIITYTFKVPSHWGGTNKFINFDWIFNYGDGNQDNVVGFTSIHIKAGTSTDIELAGPANPETICDIGAATQTFSFENPSVNHVFEFDLLKNGVEIDQTQLITFK